MKKIVLVVAILVGVAAFLIAQQGPPGPPDPAMMAQRQVYFLSRALNLTEAQQKQATTIFTSAAKAQSGAQSEMKTAREALEAAVKAGNTAGIDKAAGRIGELTAKTTAARAKADAEFFKTLTPEQQTKMAQLHQGRHAMGEPGMGPGGPGGPRGMGGPGGESGGPGTGQDEMGPGGQQGGPGPNGSGMEPEGMGPGGPEF
jgi:Spy/CpxP family protein refolding chaperone